jgi:hypothetical protein
LFFGKPHAFRISSPDQCGGRMHALIGHSFGMPKAFSTVSSGSPFQ